MPIFLFLIFHYVGWRGTERYSVQWFSSMKHSGKLTFFLAIFYRIISLLSCLYFFRVHSFFRGFWESKAKILVFWLVVWLMIFYHVQMVFVDFQHVPKIELLHCFFHSFSCLQLGHGSFFSIFPAMPQFHILFPLFV